MVSNTFAKSLGYGGSGAIKARSTQDGGGTSRKPADNKSNGDLCAVKPGTAKTYQNRAVTPGTGAKGHGGSVDKKATTKDPLQKGGSRHAK
jgi:hypothetical protein